MISEQAVIDPSAKIAENVTIGPFTVIGSDVEIGAGTHVASHVVLQGPLVMGKDNAVYQFASIGENCQDKKYNGEDTLLKIGDRNVFREGCTVQKGTKQGGGVTSIGNDNLFMGNTHVAHDCIIGNDVILSHYTGLAGHVIVDDHANLSAKVGVHQFCKIGAYSFIAAGSIVCKDVLPFVLVSGHPAKACGLNTIGLDRYKFTSETVSLLRKAYKIIFRGNNTVKEVIEKLNSLAGKCPNYNILSHFLENSERGIVR